METAGLAGGAAGCEAQQGAGEEAGERGGHPANHNMELELTSDRTQFVSNTPHPGQLACTAGDWTAALAASTPFIPPHCKAAGKFK